MFASSHQKTKWRLRDINIGPAIAHTLPPKDIHNESSEDFVQYSIKEKLCLDILFAFVGDELLAKPHVVRSEMANKKAHSQKNKLTIWK